ncbi:hypothetical protein [Streptomyces sp. G-G2]|uniref:hypothetical protein n=1 Tax=Streptomyces sp. G-G2 TaxID=3046201 RepID=UPI0024BA37C2|nr:hypothetical protein [Streptomyces sp. G-G2]MDJ0382399.1 hypothetical protein [Streptomyces sp. G-G2]
MSGHPGYQAQAAERQRTGLPGEKLTAQLVHALFVGPLLSDSARRAAVTDRARRTGSRMPWTGSWTYRFYAAVA